MPSDDPKAQNQENAGALDVSADGIARELWSVAKALEGTADRMVGESVNTDFLLMERAVGLILQAARLGLIESLVKMPEVAPEVSELLDEPRPTAPPESRDHCEQVNIQESPNSEDIVWSGHLTGVRFEEMLRQIAREGDSGEATASAHRCLLIRVLAKLWSYLSDTYPQLMSPRVAAIKHELLPGVDPWLGGERDFRKAAWLCEIVAKEITERCDLTLSQASEITGINKGTIHRSLKDIKNNGKKGRSLRLNREGLFRWKRGIYDPAKAKRDAQANARAPARRQMLPRVPGKLLEGYDYQVSEMRAAACGIEGNRRGQ